MKSIYRYLLIPVLLCALPLGAQQYRDSLRVLCIGNSFTYFSDSHLMLRDLAMSQGHYMDVNAQLQGGYTFYRHLHRDETMSALVYHRFDVVFLQDQSQTPALFAENQRRCRLVANDAAELAERVRIYSPDARIYLEQTWSYPAGNCGGFGTLEHFDELLKKGTRQMAKLANTGVSPIGEAFVVCRRDYPDIDLYVEDAKHQSAYGSYLKACVNYLMIYGEPFVADNAQEGLIPADLDPTKCAILRSIAENLILPSKGSR